MSTENERYYMKSVETVEDELDTSIQQGLSEAEAQSRLEKYGPNEIEEEERRSTFQKFIDQFKDGMIILLLIAAVISVATSGDWIDGIVILLVVLINAVMGVIQENQAEDAIDALKGMSSPHARVRRGGQNVTIDSREIVPGDVILLEAGDVVPADVRLFQVNSLQIEEAALTGESVATEKESTAALEEEAGIGDRENMAFSSTNVTYGNGAGIVVGTGMNTEVGNIAQMLQDSEDRLTPLQQDQNELSKNISYAIIIIAVFTFLVGWLFQGFSATEMLLIAVSLAVAAIPEGLPAISTIILSQGTQSMAERNAIVRTLPAVETLGSTDVICSDKTGTLTQNVMTIEQIFANGEIHDASEDFNTDHPLFNAITFANDAEKDADGSYKGDPTEAAMLKFAEKQDYNYLAEIEKFPRVEEVPFESERKLMSTIHDLGDGRYLVAVKGAPDQLIQRSSTYYDQGEVKDLTPQVEDEILQANNTMARNALRVLGGAYKIIDSIPSEVNTETVETDLIFAGLVGMIDPERPEAARAIEEANRAGIRVVMITGDHAVTAQAIAERLGILEQGVDNSSHVLTGDQLNDMSDEDLRSAVPATSVFARVSPEHKVRIVKAWQSHDKVVAMTGDGVNDAPSLKQADIGIGMGITGTEVSKGASDMVLADDNFASIIAAVEQGRKVFSNIQKAVQFLLSANLGEVLTIFIATMLGWQILEPIHLLWINLVTDTLPAIALGLEPVDSDAMDYPPRDSDTNLLSRGVGVSILYQGVIEAALVLFAYWFTRYRVYAGVGAEEALVAGETVAFMTLGILQLFHVFNVKHTFKSIFSSNPFNNKQLNISVLISGLFLVIVVLVPFLRDIFDVHVLSAQGWLFVISLGFVMVILVEIVKWILRATGYAERAMGRD